MRLVIKVAQSCLILCDPIDCSLPGSSVHGILQARILEWAAISFSRDLPDPGIEPGSPALPTDTLLSKPPGKPDKSYGKENNFQIPLLVINTAAILARSAWAQELQGKGVEGPGEEALDRSPWSELREPS